MKVRYAALVTLAMAVTLTSVAAAGPAATKQRVAINMTFHRSTFVLTPLQAGAVKSDSGTITDKAPNAHCRKVIRDGQEEMWKGGRWTLTGKRGTLTIDHGRVGRTRVRRMRRRLRHLECRAWDGDVRRSRRRWAECL